MPSDATFASITRFGPDPQQKAKLVALRRTKFFATAALCLCVALFAAARALQPRWPWLGFIAAFAEAATIGGLADWYAVVALFRRPLGLPIPHTAIIPANQNRIADNLGRFIEINFLAPEPVRAKLNEVDFAALVADWLSDSGRAGGLSGFVGRLVPQAVSAIEESGLRDFITQRVRDQIEKVRVAPLAAELLTAFTDDRRHQKLFDELIGALAKFLNDEAALDAMREKIRDELPSLFNLFRADAYLLKKIVASAGTLFEEVLADQNHALRHEFDRFAIGFIEQLRDSPEYAKRAEELKRDLLTRPELRGLADNMWKGLRDFLEQDALSEDSAIRRQLTGLFVDVGRQLADDPKIRADMNQGFVVALSSFVESQKSGVSAFIAEQVKRWDLTQLTRLIEINIGRDLQYIRFNGMLIGGLAGLVLHAAELVLFPN
jgi:uncharacterized membrane-anchored protein YjiN (DUF445 family)